MRTLARLLPLICLVVSGSLTAQGNLEPTDPPGPVMKTLGQIEPRTPVSAPGTLSASGSYYLTQSIAGSMTIDADNVSFDLNGFSISTGSPAIDLSGHFHIKIFNGRLENNAAQNAIVATGSGDVFLSDLTIVNHFQCIAAFGAIGFFEVKRVTCDTTQWNGITIQGTDEDSLRVHAADNSVINASTNNTLAAIAIGHTGTGSLSLVVTGNRVFQSNEQGIDVGSVGATTFGTVADNQVYGCDANGIRVFGDYVVTRNIAQGNGTNYALGSAPNAAPVTAIGSAPGPWDNIAE